MKADILDRKFFLRAIGLVLTAVMILACAPTNQEARQKAQNEFIDKYRKLAEKSKGYSPRSRRYVLEAPSAKEKKPTDADVQAETGRPLPTKRITLKMHNVDVAVLLRALARAAGQNIVVNEKVTGKTSLFIKDAPWNEVFRGILRTSGLTYTWEGNIIRILTVDDMEMDLKRETQRKGLQLVEPLITRLIPIHYAEAAKLKENLATLLTKGKDEKPLGTVMVDEHNNALIVQTTRSDIERMVPLIEQLDQPSAQILIEAHIVEATSDVARSLGIQWGGLYNPGGVLVGGDLYNNATTGNTLSAGAVDPTTGLAADFAAAISDSSFSPLSIGFAVESVGNMLLTAQLSALQTDGKAKILSSPSITTMDNQPAKIESGSEVPFQTVSQGEIGVEYKKAVLSLEVTPHIIEGNTLKLKISTSKDELDLTNTVSGNPIINTQKAETNVILFDGQTTVIGGLKKENRSDSEAGVPGFKDLPLLGYLFKNDTTANNLIDILIFITPHILKEKPDETEEIGAKGKPQASPAPKAIAKNGVEKPAAAIKPAVAGKAPARQPDQALSTEPTPTPQATAPAERQSASSPETGSDKLQRTTLKAAETSPAPKPVQPDDDEILAQKPTPAAASAATPKRKAPPPSPKPVEVADDEVWSGYSTAATAKPPAAAVGDAQAPQSALYTIQVGAFHNRAYALERLQHLKILGYSPYLFSARGHNNRIWYTVRIGAYDNLEDAVRALSALAKKQPYEAIVTRIGSLNTIKSS